MELNSTRLEPSSRIREDPFAKSSEEQRRQAPKRHREDASLPGDDDVCANDEQDQDHRVDDLA